MQGSGSLFVPPIREATSVDSVVYVTEMRSWWECCKLLGVQAVGSDVDAMAKCGGKRPTRHY